MMAVIVPVDRPIEENKILVRAPKIVGLLPILRGVLPTRVFDLTAKTLGVYDSMEDFKGRGKSH